MRLIYAYRVDCDKQMIVISSMLASLQMSSFLMLSLLVLPLAHLSILISVVCSLCVSFFMTAQHSDPHTNYHC